MNLICPRCRYAIDSKYKQCPNCGLNMNEATMMVCPTCNNAISRTANTCPSCGHVLKKPTTSADIIIKIIAGIILVISLLSFFGIKLQPTIQVEVDGTIQSEPIE